MLPLSRLKRLASTKTAPAPAKSQEPPKPPQKKELSEEYISMRPSLSSPESRVCSVCGIRHEDGARISPGKLPGDSTSKWRCQWCFFGALGVQITETKPGATTNAAHGTSRTVRGPLASLKRKRAQLEA